VGRCYSRTRVLSIGFLSRCPGKERRPALVSLGCARAHVAQAVEHLLGKEKVPGSNPGVGSIAPPDSKFELRQTPHCEIPGPELGSG
jgi:hypothetical protein